MCRRIVIRRTKWLAALGGVHRKLLEMYCHAYLSNRVKRFLGQQESRRVWLSAAIHIQCVQERGGASDGSRTWQAARRHCVARHSMPEFSPSIQRRRRACHLRDYHCLASFAGAANGCRVRSFPHREKACVMTWIFAFLWPFLFVSPELLLTASSCFSASSAQAPGSGTVAKS